MTDKLMDEKEENEEESENFWKQILNEVSNQSSRRTSASKTLLVLGDNGCGKSSLVSKLRSFGGKEGDLKKAGGLQYTVIDVHNEDENIKLGTWLLNGETFYSNLLEYVVTKESVKNLTVLVCADMSKPWNIIETLEHWHQKLHAHLNSLQLSAKELNEMERKIQKDFFSYYKDMEGGDEKVASTDENEPESLGENLLSNNIGIPLLVAITKSDSIATLEKDHDYHEEHFDFIQKHIRKFCLKSGAGLVYTSSKEGTNTSLLYKYLNYLIYDIKMQVQPQLVEKETLFVPTGWDNDNKIAIIDEHIKTFSSDDPYSDHIGKPPMLKPANQEKEIVAEDEQQFLEAQLQTLSKAPATAPAARPQPGGEHRVSPRGANASPGQRAGARLATPQGKGKMDATKVAGEASSETVLANFFNSLLSKDTTGKRTKPNNATAAANRSDVQAELERMSKKPTAAVKKE